MLDSKALFKPVVTPFELEMALCDGQEWDGMYSADFRDLLEWDQTPLEQSLMTATMKSADGLVRPIKLDEEEDAAERQD